MTYALPADVSARLGRVLTDDETTWVQILLNDVEEMIFDRIPNIADLVAEDEIHSSSVVTVESWSVVRFLKNPDAKRSESIDDYSYTYDRVISEGRLYITDEEWARLIPSYTFSAARVTSIDTLAGKSFGSNW